MSNLNRERLTRQQSIQCPFTNDQLDCYVECEGCPEKAERLAKINALIASGVKEVYDQYHKRKEELCPGCGAHLENWKEVFSEVHRCS